MKWHDWPCNTKTLRDDRNHNSLFHPPHNRWTCDERVVPVWAMEAAGGMSRVVEEASKRRTGNESTITHAMILAVLVRIVRIYDDP